MGNQNQPSTARKRLSTLAITTTLAAVGVGVIGTGAANAATASPLAHSQDSSSTKTAIKLAVTADAKTKTGMVDLTGTTLDSGLTDFSNVKVSIDWGDKSAADTTSITVDSKGAFSSETASHPYTDAKDYQVTVTLTDGTTTVTQSGWVNLVADPKLAAVLTPAAATTTSITKATPVTVALTGSSVDPAATKAKTTIDWGDQSTVASWDGDPAAIKTTDAKLTHTYAADGTYTVKVELNDGLGNTKSDQTATFTVTVKDGVATVQVLRAAGDDRYQTGLIISKHEWADAGVTTDATKKQAKAVVLATGNAFPDALAGVPLAKKAQGPLLLTDGGAATVNADVLTEIKRVLPTKDTTIYVLGGEKAVSKGIYDQLTTAGYTVKRLAGDDRFGTALQIAKVGMGDPSHVIVARGDEGTNHNGFADALAAGPYAANVFGGGDAAVVLSNNNAFDANTKAYVTSKLHAGQQDVAAIGGQAYTAMGTITGSSGLYTYAVGADRYETAKKVAAAFLPAGKADQVGVATGLKFADALTGGAYMATVDGPLLLTDPSALPDYTSAALSAVATTTSQVDIFGGKVAVSDDVANAVAKLVKVTTIGKF
jgi:putative cell wall-binding protein